ncbi:MAG TPA: site-2 protease family protein [Nitrolancea sp.]|nr:site-2 protease family protein [Nitrolancea sp.]
MLSPTTPQYIIATLVAFVLGITVHEFSHAWSALMLGDDTAERQGRVTLNPLSHLDPIGSIGILFLVIGGFGIGWGRPVPINPSRLRGRQRGVGLTAIAGPVSNVLLAAIFVIPLRFGHLEAGSAAYVFLRQIVLINMLLASFNLIPIPPLDGHKILTGALPNFWTPCLAPLEKYGIVVLIVLIMFGSLSTAILTPMYAPVYNLLSHLIVGHTSLPAI